MSKRIFLALALLTVATATSASAQSSFIVDNRTGSDILVANGSDGNIGIGQRDPGAQVDILSDNPQVAFRVESNSGETWLVNQNGGLQSSRGPRIVTDSNVGDEAYSDMSDTFITSGDGGSSDYDIVLNPSGDGRVNVSSNLNLQDNNVTNFFGNRCQKQEVVDGVNSDGTYQCVNVSNEIDVENLSETLEAGNVANQSIDMDDNNIVNIGKLDFDSGNPELLNPSDNSVRLRGTGGASGNLFDIVEDNSGNTLATFGDGTIGSEVRNPSSNEDIIRFNQSGGSNVEIPNGYLELYSDGNTASQVGRLVMNDENITGVNSLNINDAGGGITTGGDGIIVEESGGFLRLDDPDNVRVSSGELVVGNNAAQSGTLRLESNQWITSRNDAGDGDVNLFRLATDDEIQAGANLGLQQNNINEVDQIVGNNDFVARPETDSGSLRLESNDGTDILIARGSSTSEPSDVVLPNGQLNISRSDAITIDGQSTNLFSNSLKVSDGYGSDGLNLSSTDGIRLDSGGPSSDGNIEFQNVGVQENSGELELTGGDTRSVGGNIILDNNNITQLNELQDYYDSTECGEFRAVKGIYPNGTYICTEEILEEETEGLNETLDAGNFAGPRDIYMNGSEINDVGTGLTNFTDDGGLDLGGDLEMNGLNIHNTGNSLALDFDGDKVNVRGGLDVENDSRLRDDVELELGTDTNYDVRADSATGNLVLRNGSNQILVADSDENLRIENGYLNLKENNVRNVEAIQDNSQTDSLVFDESNNLRVPNGDLDLDNNQINDTSRLKNDGALTIEADSQDANSGDLTFQTGGSNRIEVLNDGEVRVPNSNLNLSQNQLDDVSRIDFENGANTAYIEEQSGDQLAVNSQGDSLRLQSANSQDISAESDLRLNENDIRNVGAIKDNSGTDSVILQENNSVVVPNGELDLQQNNITEFFDDNCPAGNVVERVYKNGSYNCVNVTSDDTFAQNLAEVLDIGNKAETYDINMTDQDIFEVNRVETNESGNYIDGNEASFARLGSGSDSEIDVLSTVEMNANSIESNDGQEFNVSDLQAVKDGFEVENGDITFNNSNGIRFLSDGGESRFYTEEQTSKVVLQTVNSNQRLEITESGEFIFNESDSGGNTLEINSDGSGADGNVEIGNSGGSVPVRMNGNDIDDVDQISGNSEAIESQNDLNMSDNDVNEANAVNFGGGESGERLVKAGGDLCLGDQC